MTARPRTLVLLGLVLLLLSGAASVAVAQTPKWEGDPARFQLEARLWLPEDLRASTFATGVPGRNSVNLHDTVGIREENTPELRFCFLPSPASRIRIGWLRVRYDGSNVVDGTFNFNGVQFGNGATVSGNLNQDYWYVNWAYEPLEIGDNTLRAGFVVGLHGWKSEIKLFNSAPAEVTWKRFDNFFPAVGLALDFAPSQYVTAFFEGSGAQQGADGWHLDAEAGVKVCPIKELAIVLSYRELKIDKEERDSDWFGRWRIRGPFVGVDYRF